MALGIMPVIISLMIHSRNNHFEKINYLPIPCCKAQFNSNRAGDTLS